MAREHRAPTRQTEGPSVRAARSGAPARVHAMRPAWPGRATADGSQPEEVGHPGSSALRVGLLLAALALVTAGGILIGRAVQPAASPAVTIPAGATTPQTSVPPAAAKPPLRFGPLPVRVAG